MIRSSTLLGFVALALFGFSFLGMSPYVIQTDESTMTISGTSTLHDWDCDVPDVSGRLQAASNATASSETVPADAMTPLARLRSTQVEVSVPSIECNKDRMNRNLRDALKANAYPTILFVLKEADTAAIPDSAGAWYQMDVTGELFVAGERRDVQMDVKAESQGDGTFRFVGSTSLNMEDWGVKPPSFMFGTVRTGKDVTIRFDVLAASQQN